MDGAIADLLVKRARLAQRVALWKRLQGAAVRDPGRERRVRAHYADRLRPAGWSDESVDTLLATMMHASRDLQGRLTIAIQGGPGSWSDESLAAVIPGVEVAYCKTFPEASRACRTGEVAGAWLPVENSTIGRIQGSADVADDMEAWLESDHPVRHALLAPPGELLETIERVEGHPRALEQCAATLARLLPRATLVTVIDGAWSAAQLRRGSRTAVVGSSALAARCGLEVIEPMVADRPDNVTLFRLVVHRDVV